MRKIRLLRVIIVVLLVLGCGSTDPGVSTAPSSGPIPLGRPDAALKARVVEVIAASASASPPPGWYAHLHRLGGLPDVAVEGGVVFAFSELPATDEGRASARTLCEGLASAIDTDSGASIDVHRVTVSSLGNLTLAECAVGAAPSNQVR